MKKIYFFFLFSLHWVILPAQSISFGDSTSLYIGDGTTFFFGGNTTLSGSVQNLGILVSYSDLDLVRNTDVGNLKFTGAADQNLSGDTLSVGDFIVDKQGRLILLTDRVIVTGALQTVNGSIVAPDEDDLLVSGSSPGAGQGYVEGKLVGISQGGPVTFPMGVNGAPNYVTLSDLPTGTIVSVECIVPDPTTLYPDEDMVGISDEVAWVVKAIGDSVNARFTVNFSGVDLQNLSNGRPIRAFEYEPALVAFFKQDTLFHIVEGTVQDTDAPLSRGTYISNEPLRITSEGRRLAIALVPVIVEPTFYLPNAFAPNGTIEDNRIFRPYFAGAVVNSLSFAVYDSFNNEVYRVELSAADGLALAELGWDGVLPSGLDAPEGVYYYQVNLVAEGATYAKTGSVLLVR